jgi:hypothetical protein
LKYGSPFCRTLYNEVVLAVLLALVTWTCSGASVTGPGDGCVLGMGLVSTPQPPRSTWFYPAPRFSCSAEDPAQDAFGAEGQPVGQLFWLPSIGARFASATLASFHLVQRR